jgi:hypothetical protein
MESRLQAAKTHELLKTFGDNVDCGLWTVDPDLGLFHLRSSCICGILPGNRPLARPEEHEERGHGPTMQ